MTLNRKYSQNVIKLQKSCYCCKCNHVIAYASSTYYNQTGKYIGLDCWEKEKETRKNKRLDAVNKEIEEQQKIDLESQFIGNEKKRVSMIARLEMVIFLYESEYNGDEIFLNIFRTIEGNIVTYKGKSLYNNYLLSFIDNNNDYSNKELNKIKVKVSEKFQAINIYEDNYASMSERDRQYYSRVTTKDVTILKTPEYVTLTGTIKKHYLYNSIKQTAVMRPIIKL